MLYDIKLQISYEYEGLAVGGRHIACVLPKETEARQQVKASLLDIVPRPEERLDRLDFFGNRLTEFSFRAPHDSIQITMKARVDRQAARPLLYLSLALDDLPATLAQCRDLDGQSPLHFLSASKRIPLDPGMTLFARDQLRPYMSVAEAVTAVGQALHGYMTFNARATDVDTPAAVAFAGRSGVCQDFSHIMIACLRGIGVPAGYVSGYLRTYPPPGKARLEGADAMHAWVRAWCGPDLGWIAYDPTNAVFVDTDHIIVAHGRDYADLAPIKGTMRTSGGQKSHQAVDMVPLS